MKCAIIGVAGFLGRFLTKRLLAQGSEVVGYDVCNPGFCNDNLVYNQLDIFRGGFCLPENLDAVFYFAQSDSYKNFPESANELFAVNTFGAIKAARAASQAGAGCFCYASTGNVYALSFSSHNEDDPVRRDNAYGLSKLMAEEAVELFAGKMKVISVRIFGLYGEGQRKMLPYELSEKIKQGRAIYLEPSVKNVSDADGLKTSYLYVNDAVDCLVGLVNLSREGGNLPRVLNLAGPEPVSIREFSEEIGKVVGVKPCFEVATSARSGDLVADISLLKSLLRPSFTPFKDAVQRSFQ